MCISIRFLTMSRPEARTGCGQNGREGHKGGPPECRRSCDLLPCPALNMPVLVCHLALSVKLWELAIAKALEHCIPPKAASSIFQQCPFGPLAAG